MRPPRLQRDEHGLSQTPRFALPLPMTAPSQHWPARAGQALPCTQTAREHMSRAASELISPRVSSLGRKDAAHAELAHGLEPGGVVQPQALAGKDRHFRGRRAGDGYETQVLGDYRVRAEIRHAARESRRGGGLPVGDERVELGVDAAAADAAVAARTWPARPP